MSIQPLEEQIAPLLRTLNWSLALAESCTGGLISHRVTNVPGSSDYYLGGVNAYTNSVKHQLLGVSEETLTNYGAVSEQTVLEMALGTQSLFKSDVSLSVSGIAGPGGGTPQKPVGTVWLGLAVKADVSAQCFHFCGNRLEIKNQSAEMALWLLKKNLETHLEDSHQFQQSSDYEPLQVSFSVNINNETRIQMFRWKGKDRKVESTGRQWTDQIGSHFLVMDYSQRVYELIQTNNGCWYIRPPQDSLPVI